MKTKEKKSDENIQPFSFIDKIIHEPARLNIMAYLYVVESADFLFLIRQTGLTFGNLSSHITKLEDTGYVKVIKEFIGKKHHTMIKLTKKGRDTFEEYRKNMEKFLNYI